MHPLLDPRVDRFDSAWRAVQTCGREPPQLENFRGQEHGEEESTELLVVLIAIDLSWRWKLVGSDNCQVAIQEAGQYFQAFPQLSQNPEHAVEIACAEYRARRSAGDSVSPMELAERHSHLDRLPAALLAVDEELHREGADLGKPEIQGFELLHELGRGARGVVYKARDTALQRHVAIKVLYRHFDAQPQDRLRFQQEAETLAQLQHPHVVTIHSTGETSGRLYLAMEWVEGRNLDDLLTEGELPIPYVTSLFIQVAEAVQHAHDNGVLHRDLKPANILVDEHNNARVTDFGLAKRMPTDNQLSNRLATHSHAIVGTPCFMPPEQIDASRGELGATADVYAIGATLYCLLAGRPPLRGSTNWETYRLVLEADPAPLRSLNPLVSVDLETVCMHCLEKNPSQRYQSAHDVAEELKRYQTGMPILARPTSRPTRIARWIARNPREALLWGGISLSLLALLVTTTVGSIRYSRLFYKEQEQRQEVEKALDRSENNRYIGFVQQALLQYQANNLAEAEQALKLAAPAANEKDRRDWEWFYLNRLLKPGKHRFTVGDEQAPWIGSLATTADGRYIACGTTVPWYESMEQTEQVSVRVYDLQNSQQVFSAKVPGNSATSVALSDTGDLLAVVSHHVDRENITPQERAFVTSSGTLTLFDVATSQPKWQTADLERNFVRLDITSSNKQLVTLSTAGLSVRSLETGMREWHAAGISAFQVRGDVVLVTSKADNSYLNLQSGDVLESLPTDPATPTEPFRAVRDMHLLATEENMEQSSRTVLSWDGQRRAQLYDQKVVVSDLANGTTDIIPVVGIMVAAFAPDGNTLALALGSGSIQLWNLEEDRLERTLSGHKSRLSQLSFTANGRQLVSGDWSGQIVVWELDRMQSTVGFGELSRAEYPVEAVACDAAAENFVVARVGKLAAVGVNAVSRETWERGEFSSAIPQIAPGRSAAISPSQRILAATSEDDRQHVHLWDLATGRRMTTLTLEAPIQFLCFDPNSRYVAAAAWRRRSPDESDIADAYVTVFDCKTQQRVYKETFADTRIWRMSLAAERPRLAMVLSLPKKSDSGIVSNKQNSLALVDFLTGDQLWQRSLDDAILCLGVALNEAGDCVAAGTLAGKLQLWNADDGSFRADLEGTMENVEDMTFNPSGTRLVATTRKQITIWGLQYGRRILTLPKPVETFDPIFNPQVFFNQSGDALLANNYDDTISVLRGGTQQTAD